MSAPAFTAEILRNARIQLRPKRVIAAVVICLAVSFTLIAYFFYTPSAKSPNVAGQDLLEFTFGIQIAALLIGGGLYCLQSVHREKELNTFDYQRVTRLTPIELAIGKLFGPPAMMYFVVLCTMPLILFGAYRGAANVPHLLAAYLIFIFGCITYHALTLFISLFLPKGSSAGAVILFLTMIYVTSLNAESWESSSPVLTRLSPFFAMSLISLPPPRGGSDIFFGIDIAHAYVVLALYVTLTAWFLLAVGRNMKRDPTDYEIYTPFQALGFFLYSDLLVLGFFEWGITRYSTAGPVTVPRTPGDAEQSFLFVSFWLFLILGLILLRNRDRARRRIREFGASAADWWASLWPAQYVVVGVFFCGATFMFMLRRRLDLNWDSSTGMAVFEIAFFALWIVRDLLFLQWANLRRSRRPLFSGVLYLIAYYGCAIALFSLIVTRSSTARIVYSSALFPGAALGMNFDSWTSNRHGWFIAMIVLAAEAFVFVYLQRRTLQNILTSVPSESAAIQQSLTPK